jgi:hypothetical protein
MPRKSLLVASIVLCVSATLMAQAQPRDIIPAGTILQCTLDEPNFSSKTAMVGDPVLCHLGQLSSFGHAAFPRGAMLGGHLQDYKNPGRFVGKGWMAIEFDRLVLPNAQILPLSAKVISAPHMKVDAQGDIHGKGHAIRDSVEWAIPVLWPIKILTLPARGPYPAFKGETRIALRLMDDVEVPFSTARSNVPMPPWATPSYQPSSYGVFRPASATTADNAPAVQTAAYTDRIAAAEPLSTEGPAEQPLTIIALKGGAAFLAKEYWVQGGQMACISADGEQKMLPLEKIDLYETTRLNRERKVDFVLQSRDAATEQ